MDPGNFGPPNPGQGHSHEQQALHECIDPILNFLRGNNPQQQQQQGYSGNSAINSTSVWHQQQQQQQQRRGLEACRAPPASAYEAISDKGNMLHQQQHQRRQQQQIAQAHSHHSTRAELEHAALQFANNKHQQPLARPQPPSIDSNISNNNDNEANQDRSQHASYHRLPSAAALLGGMRSQSEQQLAPSSGNWPISPCLLAAATAAGHHQVQSALYGNPHASSSSASNSPPSLGDIYTQQQQHINRMFQSMLHSHQAAAQQQQQQQHRAQVSRDPGSGSTTSVAQMPQLPPSYQPPCQPLPGQVAAPPAAATTFDLYSTLQSYAALTHTYMSRGGFGSAVATASSAPGLLHHLQGTLPAAASATAAATPSVLLAPAGRGGNNETILATNPADDNDMPNDDHDHDHDHDYEDNDGNEDDDDRGGTIQRTARNRRLSQAAVGPLESATGARANLFETKRKQHHARGISLEDSTMSAPPAIAHNRNSEDVEQLSTRLAAGARSSSLRGVASTTAIIKSHNFGRATGRNSSSLSPPSTVSTFRVAGRDAGARRSNSDDTSGLKQPCHSDQNKQAREYNENTTTDDDVKMSSISIDDGNDTGREKQGDEGKVATGCLGEQKVRDDDAKPYDEGGGGSSGSTPCNNGRIRTAYSSMQILNLEREFAQNMYLSRIRRIELAQKLNLSEKQVKIWFQNRRVKYKKENTALSLSAAV